jgi:EmrB/QacA subfamily drug resistance transporter
MAATTTHVQPIGYERRWWILGVLCLSLLVIGLDNTILNVALPTLVRDLGASNSQLQWIVDAYTLVFAGLLLTAGSLSDRYGRRSALGLGLLVFGVGSALSAWAGPIATSLSNAGFTISGASLLIFTRAFMGLGGALIMPSTLSILTNVFPAQERGRAIGIWAGVSGLGIGLGPVVGGYLLNHFWWGSVFLANVPVVIAAFIAGRLIVPNSKDPSAPRIDPVGAGLSIVGLVTLVYGLIEAPSHGWTSRYTMSFIGVGLVVLALFVMWELWSDHPMLNVRFFENPRFSAANIAVTLVFFALFGSLFFQPQYLQFVLGYSPLEAGLRVAPIAIVLVVVSPISGRLTSIVGNKVLVTIGLVVVATGLFVLARTSPESGYLHVLVSILILGTGMAIAMTPATESIMGSLPLEKAGVGSAMNDTTRQVGGALGVAVLGSVFATSFTSHIAPAVQGLPPEAQTEAARGVGEALGVAQSVAQANPQQAQALVESAKVAFIDAMDKGLIVAVIVVLVGAVVALAFLPNRAEPDQAELERIRQLDEQSRVAHVPSRAHTMEHGVPEEPTA